MVDALERLLRVVYERREEEIPQGIMADTDLRLLYALGREDHLYLLARATELDIAEGTCLNFE